MKAKRKTTKRKESRYATIGVRFLGGNATGAINHIYTYKVRRGAKLHLGQLLIADNTPYGYGVVCVVRIDKDLMDTDPAITYKSLTLKAAPL